MADQMKAFKSGQFFCHLGASVMLCFMASVSFAQDTKVSIGAASYAVHTEAFSGLVEEFIGSYSPSIQNKWFAIAFVGSLIQTAENAEDIEIERRESRSISVGHEISELFANDRLSLEVQFSSHTTQYYFPDGISPFVEPITLDIQSYNSELALNYQIAEFDIGQAQIELSAAPGWEYTTAHSHMHSPLLNVRDRESFVHPFLRSKLSIAQGYGEMAVQVKKSQGYPVEIGISHGLRF